MKKLLMCVALCVAGVASAEFIQFKTFTNINGGVTFKFIDETNSTEETLTISGQDGVSSKNDYSVGTSFSIEKLSEPSDQICTFSPKSGTVDIGTQIQVTCERAEPVLLSVAVSGLNGTLTLEANNGDTLSFSGNNKKKFATPFKTGQDFEISKTAEPDGQTCTISPASGTISTSTKITVTCDNKSNQQNLDVNVMGLTGTLVIANGNDELSIDTNGSATFSQTYTKSTPYEMRIVRQPTGQTCYFEYGQSGKVTDGIEASIRCSSTTGKEYVLSVKANLSSKDKVIIQNDKGEELTFTSIGITKRFNERYKVNAQFTLEFVQIPMGQTCQFDRNKSETINGVMTEDKTVAFTCRQGGTTEHLDIDVKGLSGELTVNYGKDSLTITSNGKHRFDKSYPKGQSFKLDLISPNNQTCEVKPLLNSIGEDVEAEIQCKDKANTGIKSLKVDAPAIAAVGETVTFNVTSENFPNDCISALTFYPEYKKDGSGNETPQFIKAPNGDCLKTLTATHTYGTAGTYDVTFYYEVQGIGAIVRAIHKLTIQPRILKSWMFADGFEAKNP